ncbi:MAG: sensor histidine kinase [Roseiflexaceae bacterium]|nr:sensor histidine kinase [Roseiflexaceae bacterium]
MHIPVPLPAAPVSWQRWLVPRSSDWMPAFLYVGVLLDYVVLHHSTLYRWQTLLVVGALAVLAGLERWEHWRYGEQAPMRLRQLMFAINLLLIEVVAQISFTGIGSFLYLILPLKAWLAFGRGAGYMTAAGVMALYVAKTGLAATQLEVPIEQLISGCIMFGTAIAFVLTISHLATRDRLDRERAEQLLDLVARSHRDLERSHDELAVYAAQVADLAAVAERNRVARDIHDSLGHYLTAITIQLEKALAFHEKDRQESQRSVQTSRRLAQEALTDVRHSVGLLRSQHGSFSLASMLHDLAAYGIDGQPNVAVHIAGEETAYTLELRMVLYRAAQEGLTNIRRHAQAQHAWVDVRFDDTCATLTVSDDGVGFDPVRYEAATRDQTAGYGIQGLRERVALIGGSLEIVRAHDCGTLLTVVLPSAAAGRAQPAEAAWATR